MKRIFAIACLFLASASLLADQVPEQVRSAMSKIMPGIEPAWVKPAPIADFFEVAYGPHLFYISTDGRYLLRGDVLDLENNRNLTQPGRKKARLTAIESLGEESMIVYEPEKARHTVTIFTDIDCPYCQKMHAEMQDYLDKGIRVRYLAYPRGGIPSRSYDRTVAVWCSNDRQKAMTDAKAQRPVVSDLCENPVADHYQMGHLVGVRGTPTIILDSGDIIPGYVPANELSSRLIQGGTKG